jgi:outer membrane biosynthesis protein TonB
MRRRDLGRYPAFVAAAALHLAVLAAALIVLPKPMSIGDVTTVTLMTSQDMAAPREAEPSPTPTPAQTEIPDLNAPPAQPAPRDAQTPAPPAPTPTPPPKPQPKPSPKATNKPTPAKDNFFSDMDKSLNPSTKTASGKPANAQQGRNQHQTSTTPPITHGSGTNVSASALSAYQAELMRLWNPNCDVMGGADVNIVVNFRLGPGGRVLGQPSTGTGGALPPMIQAASDRAIRAVKQAPPHPDLPADTYHVTFNAKQACAQR